MGDRILWNRQPAPPRPGGGGGDIDEIVVRDCASVHVEQMGNRCWWIGIRKTDGGWWAGNFTADQWGRMKFAEQENLGVSWDVEREHDR